MKEKVCYIGGARYGCPLDPTTEKKFIALKGIGEIYVIGFSRGVFPRRFTQHAKFYLFPDLSLRIVRYLIFLLAGPILVVWLVFQHEVRTFIAQSPYEGFAASVGKKVAVLFHHRVAVVIENHGDFEEAFFFQQRVVGPGFFRRLMRFAAGYSLRNADILRAVSEFTAKQLKRWAPGTPIYIFSAWTDIEVFRQAGTSRKNLIPKQMILYAGVLTPLKGVHHLINAFSKFEAEFPEAQLILIGREQDRAYSGELRNLVKHRGICARVHFKGEMIQEELAQHMQQASVFVLPSLSEGLGRVLIEAMAVGLPVVASSVSGIPELVCDGDNGFLCPPGDEERLADRLRWILGHPLGAMAIGHRGRNRVEKIFSTEMYVQGYRQIFMAASDIANFGTRAA